MSTNMHYLITLRPTGNFYFGSEKHFSFGGKNYLVKSNPFPQQTTLLGMLRYELLRKAGLLNGVNKAQEIPLIGPSGFNGSNTQGYGIISKLSPVFLHNQQSGENYVPRGFCFQKGQPIVPNGTVPPVLLRGYDAKAGEMDQRYVNPASGNTVLLNDIYLYPTQTGNQKNNKPGTDEEALYKQTWCRFANKGSDGQPVKWCFAFYLETTAPLPLDNHILVSIGGDQSSFILHYQPAENNLFLPNLTAEQTGAATQLTLLSDARSDTDLGALSIAAIAFTTDFRYIETTAATKNYHNVSYRKADDTDSPNMLRSGKYSLYKAGSVFWLEAAHVKAFTDALQQPAFKNIGYNYYSTEKIQL